MSGRSIHASIRLKPPGRRRSRAPARVAAVLCGIVACGCALFEIKRQQDQLGAIARLHGSVRTEHVSDRPLVVVLAGLTGSNPLSPDDWRIVDHFVSYDGGTFLFGVQPGQYRLGAFEDVNADLTFDPDEPVLRLLGSSVFELDWGGESEVDLVIPSDGRVDLGHSVDIAALVARSYEEQLLVSYRSVLVRGEVRSLDDPHFDPAHGKLGLWRPYDFLVDVGPGVYFLAPFDADKVPVLFVHGMSGHPREFTRLIDELDADRFQPWVLFYPTAADPSRVASSLVEIMAELQLRFGFRELALVAHSMGGLVSREFLLEHAAAPRFRIPLFVSIATPWGGDAAAEGAERIDRLPGAMSLPNSFRAMAPQGDFIRQLFEGEPSGGAGGGPRLLPGGTDHHLVFGYHRNEGSSGASSDGRVDLISQLRPEAQDQSVSRFGVNAGHVDILEDPATSRHLNSLLAAYFRE